MFSKRISFFLFIIVTGCFSCTAQERIIYKQIDTIELMMQIHSPENMDTSKTYPGIVFFFGGGWVGGSINQFEPHAKHFSQRGMVCFLAEYRVKSRHGTEPFEALKDAKSAVRFIRMNAEEFHLDPSRLVAAGGSAGGHLAAATAVIDDYNENTDDTDVSCIPNALILFNPVIDNGPGGYGYERIGEAYKDFSPLHNIKTGTPPTLILLGTEDQLIPVETAQHYKLAMEKAGSRCEVVLYEGESHGFFNYGRGDKYSLTLQEADHFLQSLGYLEAKPEKME